MNTPTVRTRAEGSGDGPGEGQVSNGDGAERTDRPGPRIGDAIGETLRIAYQASRGPYPAPVFQIAERDDGMVRANPVAPWIAPVDQWSEEDRQALDLLKG